MFRRFEGETCALCRTRPSSPTGEHVWPSWFLKQFGDSDGPYTRFINGRAETKRDNVTIRKQVSIERVKLPSCVECNSVLDERFEHSAKPIMRRLMATDGRLTLNGDDAQTLGLWLLKTWLLLAHPAARGSNPGEFRERWDLARIPDDLYSWTVHDGPVPNGLSVWVVREDRYPVQAVRTRRIPLPTVVADGRTMGFQDFRCSVRFLDVTLVYHPGWEIAHPLEAEGRAARLWPSHGQPVNFESLVPVASRDTIWMEGPILTFAPGSFGAARLPPLGPGWDPMFPPVPGVVHAGAPRLHSQS